MGEYGIMANKDNKHNTGLIIYRKINEEQISEIVKEVLKLYRLRKNSWVGGISDCGSNNKYAAYQLRDKCFFNYSNFDSFLYELGYILDDLDNIGLLIGHCDKDGFMWMDYNNPKFPRKEIIEIAKKFKKPTQIMPLIKKNKTAIIIRSNNKGLEKRLDGLKKVNPFIETRGVL